MQTALALCLFFGEARRNIGFLVLRVRLFQRDAASRVIGHSRQRTRAADVALSAASFQPENATTNSGRRRSGGMSSTMSGEGESVIGVALSVVRPDAH